MNCNTKEWQKITDLCLEDNSKNPIEIMCKLMDLEFCNVKGREHRLMVSAALLTAYYNTLNEENASKNCVEDSMNLSKAFQRMEASEEFDIGGDCDYWKACEIIDGARIFWSLVTDGKEPIDIFTMEIANAVGSVCGQRCCKRNAYLAISGTVEFVDKHLGIKMESTDFVCKYSKQNHDCLLEDCPYNEHYIVY